MECQTICIHSQRTVLLCTRASYHIGGVATQSGSKAPRDHDLIGLCAQTKVGCLLVAINAYSAIDWPMRAGVTLPVIVCRGSISNNIWELQVRPDIISSGPSEIRCTSHKSLKYEAVRIIIQRDADASDSRIKIPNRTVRWPKENSTSNSQAKLPIRCMEL
jgi:hypothetical protein